MTPIAELGKVLVIYGGTSAERAISLESGEAVLGALQSQGIEAQGLDLAKGLSALLESDFDRAFIALHGRGGEDGSIQGMLELMGKPYTGSRVMASAVAMDKVSTKRIWQGLGLPTPNFAQCRSGEKHDALKDQVAFPVMVKPAHEGSSIGMSRVDRAEDLDLALAEAEKYDGEVFVEQFVTGREYTVGILGEEALPVIGLSTPHRFFDYDAKYQATDTDYQLPSGLSAELEVALQRLALEAYQALGCEGWGRVDLMLDTDGRPWLLEVNTIPGMTSHSLVPMAAQALGMDFEALVRRILELSE